MNPIEDGAGLGPTEEFDLEAALAEAEEEVGAEAEASHPDDGAAHLDDAVILELAHRVFEGLESVRLANLGLNAVLGLGRKGGDGLKVTLDESRSEPTVTLDAYVLLRYGLRIPDKAWDLQEKLKKDLERVTGYQIKAVNIHVQGIYFDEDGADALSD